MLSTDKTRIPALTKESLHNLQKQIAQEQPLHKKNEFRVIRPERRSLGDGAESVSRLMEDLHMNSHRQTPKAAGDVAGSDETEVEFGKAGKRPLPRGESSSKLLVSGGEKTTSGESLQNGVDERREEDKPDKEEERKPRSDEKDDVKGKPEKAQVDNERSLQQQEEEEKEEAVTKKPTGGYTSDDLEDNFAYDSEDLQDDINEENEYEMFRQELVGEPSSSALSSSSESEEDEKQTNMHVASPELEEIVLPDSQLDEGQKEKEDAEDEVMAALLAEIVGERVQLENEEEEEESSLEEEDDDEDEDDDEEEEEESEEEEEAEDDKGTSYYSSSPHGSISSIPTYYSDNAEETLDSSSRNFTAMSERLEEAQNEEEASNGGSNENVLLEKDVLDKNEEEELSEIEAYEEQENYKQVEETEPKCRLVSGKSASPEGTIVLSEFDDQESTIYDQREAPTPNGRASLNITTSHSSEKSEVDIRNWSRFTHITNSSEHQVQCSSDNNDVNIVSTGHEKTRKKKKLLRRPKRTNEGVINMNNKKQILKHTDTKVSKAKHVNFVPQHRDSSSSDCEVSEKLVRKRPKKKSKSRVESGSLEKSDPIRTTNDSAFFGSRTNGNGSTDDPIESEYSDRRASSERDVSSEKETYSSASPASSAKCSRSSALESVNTVYSTPEPVSRLSHFNPSRQSHRFSRQSFIAWKKSSDESSRSSLRPTPASSQSSFIRKVKLANKPQAPEKRKTLKPLRHEFEKPPFAPGINLNSSYKVAEYQHVLIANSKRKAGNIGTKYNESMSERDDYDSYDDDFESSSPYPQQRNSSRYSRARSISQSMSKKQSSTRDIVSRTRSRQDSFTSYRSAYGTVNYSRGPPRRGKKSRSVASKTTYKSHGESKTIHRVLSASRNRVTHLHNIVEELQREADELKQDNRTLKRINQKQEKELKKVDGDEGELPVLLERHSAEMRSLRERLRRNKNILREKDRGAQMQDSEMLKLRDKVKQLKVLSQDKKLEERAALSQKLVKVENSITEKDKKIMNLEKALTLKEKAKQRELKEQRDKYRQAKGDLQRLKEDYEGLKMRLQNKEKELELKNLYHRHITQKKRVGQTLALPMAAPSPPREARAGSRGTKPPNVFLTNASSDSTSQVSEASPRGLDDQSVTSVLKENALERAEVEKERRRREEDEENARRRREEDERTKKEEKEQERRRKELEEEEERRRKREEDEMREKRLREEEEQREKRLKEEEEQREKRLREEERERKESEEIKRQQEEEDIRRKKNLLLARMRVIDNTNQEAKPSEDILEAPKDPKPTKLPIFLQSNKVGNETGRKISDNGLFFSDNPSDKAKSSTSSGNSRHNYDFKQTVDNLHHGIPAHASEERINGIKKASASEEDVGFGGYKPSLGRRGRRGSKGEGDKSDGFVFGGYAPSVTGESKNKPVRKNSGLNFSDVKKAEPAKVVSTFGAGSGPRPAYEDPFSAGLPQKAQTRRRSRGETTIFGEDIFGFSDPPKPSKASPVFGDDLFKASSKNAGKDVKGYPWENRVDLAKSNENVSDSLLPRRKRMQLSSFSTAPRQNVRAIGNALDDVDDEIEEVIL